MDVGSNPSPVNNVALGTLIFAHTNSMYDNAYPEMLGRLEVMYVRQAPDVAQEVSPRVFSLYRETLVGRHVARSIPASPTGPGRTQCALKQRGMTEGA